jgi:hypothetical protein
LIAGTTANAEFLPASPSTIQEKFAEGSESRELQKIHGNMAAAFTPVDQKGNLDFTNIEKMAARYQEWGVKNVMIGGTTGESVSFNF